MNLRGCFLMTCVVAIQFAVGGTLAEAETSVAFNKIQLTGDFFAKVPASVTSTTMGREMRFMAPIGMKALTSKNGI